MQAMSRMPEAFGARLTVREAFFRFVVPELSENKRGTRAAYEQSVRDWERHVPENPPIGEVTNALLAKLRASLLAQGYSPATINRIWRGLRRIFRRVGPQVYGNPMGEGLLERVPHMRPVPQVYRRPRVVSFGELDALYAACPAAPVPSLLQFRREERTWLWRALLVVAYNLGPRFADLFALTPENVDWRGARLRYKAQKTGFELDLPLNRTVRRHLAAIAPASARHGRLFGMAGRKQIYLGFAALRHVAGIDMDVSFHDLRRTCQSEFDAVLPGLGDWFLGHMPRDVGGRYYRNLDKPAKEAAEKLPQPPSFLLGERAEVD